jgi:hypothetical protein
MAILPIDMQAILLRMENISKYHQQQEGMVIAQIVKGDELSRLAQLDSSRVNEVKPPPDNSGKVEDKGQEGGEKKSSGRGGKGGTPNKTHEPPAFKDPYKGNIIDTVR